MPYRNLMLKTGQIYHIYNRSIEGRPIFNSKAACQRAVRTLDFYCFDDQPVSLSVHLRTHLPSCSLRVQAVALPRLQILAYCFMSNHYHFLLKQERDGGISQFVSDFQNSYTRYFNSRERRVGPIFAGPFKGVRIGSQSQLLHVSRYIHLNPYTGYLVNNKRQIRMYPWSSYGEYMSPTSCKSINTSLVMQSFKSREHYEEFVMDQADYQRKLAQAQHLFFDEEGLAPEYWQPIQLTNVR